MKRSEVLKVLKKQSSEWILRSYKNPNQYMSKTVLALHLIALRQRGENV